VLKLQDANVGSGVSGVETQYIQGICRICESLMGKFRKVSAIFFIALNSMANATVSKGPERGSMYICRVFGPAVYEWKNIYVLGIVEGNYPYHRRRIDLSYPSSNVRKWLAETLFGSRQLSPVSLLF
jgi:hypothetical protein